MTQSDNDTPADAVSATRPERLRRRSEAMAAAAGWALVVHVCAAHQGHPHAETMFDDDRERIEEAGAMVLVLEALGDELGDQLGHDDAIEALRQQIASGVHPVPALAELVAASIDYDGARALATHLERQHVADFWAVIDDAME